MMKTMWQRAFQFAMARKILSIAGALIIFIGGLWVFGYFSEAEETTYTIEKVSRGDIVATISGSGQVSATNQIDIKPKASGDVVSVSVKNGQWVNQGQLIASIDAREAAKAVRDAEVNLKSAELSHEKLKRPPETLNLIQAEYSVEDAVATLEKSYEDGFNAVAAAFLKLPTVMSGLDSILYGKTVNSSGSQDNVSAYADMVSQNNDITVNPYKEDAVAKYQKARTAYDATFLKYRAMTRSDSKEKIESLIQESYETTRTVTDAVKSTNDFLGFVKDKLTTKNMPIPSALTTHISSVSTYVTDSNALLTSVLHSKDALVTAKYSVTEKKQSLVDLKEGTDAIDLESSELTLSSRRNALLDARQKLADYYVRAPFAGTIASLEVKRYDSVSSGSAVATLITSEKRAEISLNEVDVAKVKVGQLSEMTFDAIEDLTLEGVVADIDTVGTVTQGVVTYTVAISFKDQDERIKPGMSVSALITTASAKDVVRVPSAAIKTERDGAEYVEVPDEEVAVMGRRPSTAVTLEKAPRKVPVKTGLTDDTLTEIIEGLSEDDILITKVSNGSSAAVAQTPSLFGALGGRGSGGGGAVRAAGGTGGGAGR